MGREIPTCPRKLTVLCCVTSLCCYWVLWVIQCIWSSTLTTAAAPQQPERACNCAVDRVYLTIVIAVTSTYTHFNTISASHHSLKKNDWTLKLLKSFICPFFFQALFICSIFHHLDSVNMHTSFPKGMFNKKNEEKC